MGWPDASGFIKQSAQTNSVPPKTLPYLFLFPCHSANRSAFPRPHLRPQLTPSQGSPSSGLLSSPSFSLGLESEKLLGTPQDTKRNEGYQSNPGGHSRVAEGAGLRGQELAATFVLRCAKRRN